MATIYRQGDRGEVVAQIQKVIGCYPDGVWGPVTTECVKKWQAAHGLASDGLVGPATLTKMGLTAAAKAIIPDKGRDFIYHDGIVLKRSKRKITDIVIHCTATRCDRNLTVDDIRRIHKGQGWADIGYHYVITLDGKAHIGRDVDVIGAHVSGHNAHTIGVAYVGGIDKNGAEKDTRNLIQKAELLNLLGDLRRLYPDARICGHRDFSPDKNGNGTVEPFEWIKQCPCFDAKKEFEML